MSRRSAVAVLLALVAAGAALFPRVSTLQPLPARAAAPRVGQWIWSRTDVAAFTRARVSPPELVPAVFVASVDVPTQGDGKVAWHRRLSPTLAGESAAVVLRFEDGFHRVWSDPDDASVAARVVPVIHTVAREIAATSVDVLEVQLDYDAPVRVLPRWAALVRALSAGPLGGRSVWITTVPAHLRAPMFHAAFHGVVAGHIVQVFDTGLACTDDTVRALSNDLRRAALPFRVGIGAFERGRVTEHGCWVDATSRLGAVPGFSGTWVFGAAQETAPVFSRLAARSGEGS